MDQPPELLPPPELVPPPDEVPPEDDIPPDDMLPPEDDIPPEDMLPDVPPPDDIEPVGSPVEPVDVPPDVEPLREWRDLRLEELVPVEELEPLPPDDMDWPDMPPEDTPLWPDEGEDMPDDVLLPLVPPDIWAKAAVPIKAAPDTAAIMNLRIILSCRCYM